ncbi:MAG TPA: haloacid dehalogenase type II [Gemmatimonadales bacterium]|nr:haloacid dehalogenase type II [Gemmatimonadales bacterium]
MTAGAPLRVLAFDVFGTVVDWRGGIIAAGEQLAARHRLRADWPALADAWRAAYQPSMERVRRGERPWTGLDVLHRESLDALAPRFGLDGLGDAERSELTRAWHALPPWPDAADGLARLRRRYLVATLSNGPVALLVALARHGGLVWDCVLSAELVRRYKPDPEAYLQVPRLLAVSPGEVLMVAAHQDDLTAARSQGLRTAYVHRPLEFGPGAGPTRPAPGTFDYEVGDFLELAARLGP